MPHQPRQFCDLLHPAAHTATFGRVRIHERAVLDMQHPEVGLPGRVRNVSVARFPRVALVALISGRTLIARIPLIALLPLFARRSLRPLRTFGTFRPLRTLRPLVALVALRATWT